MSKEKTNDEKRIRNVDPVTRKKRENVIKNRNPSLWEIGAGMFKANFKNPKGQPRVFYPDELFEAALAYFKWAESNPLLTPETYKSGDELAQKDVKKVRPFTLDAFLTHSGCPQSSFYNYEKKPEYMEVISFIRGVIRTQKFEMATVGVFNSKIIMRDLELHDHVKQDVTSNGQTIRPKIEFVGDGDDDVPQVSKDDDVPQVSKDENGGIRFV